MSSTTQYPIEAVMPELLQTMQKHNTAILQAPPGAGKSTVLPIQFLEADWLQGKKIILLQPRKLAARTVAERLSNLLQKPLGDIVGYRVKFEQKTSINTRIEVITEGLLTRMLQHDNAIEEVGMVIFDEFHERSLHCDLALALCREVQQVVRPDLRILIMSATLDGARLSTLLDHAPIITAEGRQYPIDIRYLNLDSKLNVVQRMEYAILKAYKEQEGNILAFLPGIYEINTIQKKLNQALPDALVLPLHGTLTLKEQQVAIQNKNASGQRSIILATSIAETSITIEGITTVVDCGISRVPQYDLNTGMTRLETKPSSKDTTTQRAGRAGRLGPGTCYRIWDSITQLQKEDHITPEILQADLSPTLLEIYQWGAKDFNQLQWLTLPTAASVSQAADILQQLSCIHESKITSKGKQVNNFPTHPRLANMLLLSKSLQLEALAGDLAALLEEKDPMHNHESADIYDRLLGLLQFRNNQKTHQTEFARIDKQAQYWHKLMGNTKPYTIINEKAVGQLIATAFPERIAKKTDKESLRYRMANGKIVKLKSQDPLAKEEWLAIAHADGSSKEGNIYLASSLDCNLLPSHEERVTYWDFEKGILICGLAISKGGIVLETRPIPVVSSDPTIIEILIKVVQKEGLQLLHWTNEAIQFRSRLLFLSKNSDSKVWQNLDDQWLLSNLDHWLAPYVSSIKKKEDFKKLNLLEMLQSILDWEQLQQVNALAPTAISVPSGFEVPIAYQADGSKPILAVRLQEMFGLTTTPTINNGQSGLLLHLLSPGYKPVQITQDLHSFWTNTYPEVRKTLKIRYQRHSWPEDPWTAEAVRGAKKRNS